MWELWLLVSAMLFSAAAYLAIGRLGFKYPPHQVVYEPRMPAKSNALPTNGAPINAEYSVSEGGSTQSPAASFFSEMGNAVAGGHAQVNSEESGEQAKLRNLRFFDS